MISKAINGDEIPIYGTGKNIREWVYVKDHCHGIYLAMESGLVGQSYCLGGYSEIQNIELVSDICEILDQIVPRPNGLSFKDQIIFTDDRPGHDFRYALNFTKAKTQLGYDPKTDFCNSLSETIKYYLNNVKAVNED